MIQKKNDILPLNDEGNNMHSFDSFSFHSYLFEMENNFISLFKEENINIIIQSF